MSFPRQVPLMSCDDVDLSNSIKHFIRGHYGTSEKYTEEYSALQRLRQDMRGAGKDEVGRDLLYRYYGQLELLELRFPIDEDHIRISFNWYDAFTEVGISQYSLAYEKACVLFNIAAVLSFIASSQTRSDPAGMKKAYHSLQACAGLLNFINDNFLHAPSTDLSRESVKAISAIMLAQAQEIFVEKQIKDEGKSSIISKLAAEASNLYHTAHDSLTEIWLAGNIDAAWVSYSACKEKLYGSIAAYHQALFDAEKNKNGTAVARLQSAVNSAKEAQSIAKSNTGQFNRYPHLSNDPGTALAEITKAHFDLVSDKFQAVKKENDIIYHEVVPKENILPNLARLASAKPIALHDLYAGQDVSRIIGPDIFRKLIPLAVHESASMYSEEIAKLLRSEQERSDIADSELATTLDHLGLPDSLNQLKASFGKSQMQQSCPEHIHHLAATAQGSDRQAPVSDQIRRVQDLRLQIQTSLNQISKLLEEESRQCETMHSRYRQAWTQTPSSQANQGLMNDMNNYRQSLDTAMSSDSKMFSEYQAVEQDLGDLLNPDKKHLDSLFLKLASPNTMTSTNTLLDLVDEQAEPDLSVLADQVSDCLRKLNVVKKERRATLDDLKEKARKDDISDVLIFNKRTPDLEQRVFATELEKFRPHQTRISATLSRQDQLMRELTTTFETLMNDKSSQLKRQNWQDSKRLIDQKIKDLEKAASVHGDIALGIGRALTFYNELIKLVTSLDSQTRQFLAQRQNEGRDLLSRITSTNLSSAMNRTTLGNGYP